MDGGIAVLHPLSSFDCLLLFGSLLCFLLHFLSAGAFFFLPGSGDTWRGVGGGGHGGGGGCDKQGWRESMRERESEEKTGREV